MSEANDEMSSIIDYEDIDEVRELAKGLVVIVDDAFAHQRNIPLNGVLSDSASDYIWDIRDYLIQEGYPVAVYPEVPSAIDLSITGASFFIVDWNMARTHDEIAEGAYLGSTLIQDRQEDVLEFVYNIISGYPVPVFIFTNGLLNEVKDAVQDYFALHDLADRANELIVVRSKQDVGCSTGELFKAIGCWFRKNPAAYVMGAWRKTVVCGANDLFNRLYDASPSWPSVIWKTLTDDLDGGNAETNQKYREMIVSNEFGSYLTRILSNTLTSYSISAELVNKVSGEAPPDVVRSVIQQERYIDNNAINTADHKCRCGDLFEFPRFFKTGSQARKLKKNLAREYGYRSGDIRDYLLVISADCDLVRRDDPVVAVVTGSEVSVPDNNKIELSRDKPLLSVYGQSFELKEGEIDNINTSIEELIKNLPLVNSGGDLIRRNNETIIPCIAGKKAIAFQHRVMMFKYSDIRPYFIGRLLAPYVTKVQQGAANHLIRAALEPIPRGAFD